MQPGKPLGVEEARSQILSLLSVLPAASFPLEDSLGLTLAQDVLAGESHPSHHTSAMDGYAVRAADLEAASQEHPLTLPCLHEVAAGFPGDFELSPGQVARINTGGLLPLGSDSVVMREEVSTQEPNLVTFYSPVAEGSHVRYAGEHLRRGEAALSAGTVLQPAHLSLGAYLGVSEWSVIPPPRVAIVATGSELVEGGRPLAKGQVRDSNSVGLAAALRQLGCVVVYRDRVADNPAELEASLQKAFEVSDVVLTSGGISAGWHDHVKSAIEKHDGRFLFHKLKMRPGKPLGFGICEGSLFFCLPGNPVSSLVTFELFVVPALQAMMGRPWRARLRVARLAEPISKKRGFSIFYRGVLQTEDDKLTVRLTGPQGSHILRSLADANVLIWTTEDDEELAAGSEVRVLDYPSGATTSFAAD